jgi:hydroxymethylpyrimidine/phosphomethylpyrimidine kinase
MSENRPYVLTIAGLDPTGGAGILADIKTFEQHQVTGFAISTANTIQTENQFHHIQWTDLSFVLRSIETLFENYKIKTVKIGITPSLPYLNRILSTIKLLSPTTKIVWDPVLKSTTAFEFMKVTADLDFHKILSKIDLITPNYNEMQKLFPEFESTLLWKTTEGEASILLKGAHNLNEIGVDYLYTQNGIHKLLPKTVECHEKHGSGCVLSASITANLALGQNLKTACENAKKYTENYLLSNSTKLGFHHV